MIQKDNPESQNISSNEVSKLFPKRDIPKPKQINFIVDSKPADHESSKLYVIELDISFECRVGDLLEATDNRTGRKFLLMVSDIDYAFPHREEHAQMLDIMRQRHKEVDQETFNALCKNIAICNLLGELKESEISESGYRPSKYTTTVISASKETEKLMAVGWDRGVPLGCLRIGREEREEILIHFPSSELAGKRVLIVGQTGKGKSTTMRQLLDGHIRQASSAERKVGYLVDDFKMEYPFAIPNERGDEVPGLVDTLGKNAKDNLVVLTAFPDRYSEHSEKLKAITRLSIPLDEIPLSVFCDLANLTEPQANVVRLVEGSGKSSEEFFSDLLAVDEHGMPDTIRWGKKYGRIFYSDQGKRKARKGEDIDDEKDLDSKRLTDRLPYIRSAAQRMLNMPFISENKSDSNCLPALIDYLRSGYTIIVDKSDLTDHQRELLTVLLLSHLFMHNQKLASGGKSNKDKMVPVVVAVEEAQYLLSKDKVADPDSIFAKIAFTGRSYQIGLLAITQRPQAIQKELLGQFDGFFVLPLEHANDFRHLAEACPALAGYRNDLAFGRAGSGVLAYGTPKRVVSVQIKNYEGNPEDKRDLSEF
jgi:hypothetical protein